MTEEPSGQRPPAGPPGAVARRTLLAAAGVLLLPAAARAGRGVTEAALWRDGATTTLTLRLPATTRWTLFPVPDPPRLVLDLLATPWQVPALPAGAGIVHGVRAATNRPGVTRVVLDLAEPAALRLAAFDAERMALVVAIEPAPLEVFMQQSAQGPVLLPPTPTVRDTARAQTASLARPLPRPPDWPRDAPPLARPPLVVIDPGHGGRDPGAIGARGTFEKHIVLAAARDLRDSLRERRRYRVLMTRDRDVFIPLADRVSLAQTRQADLLLSIHADALDDRSVRGASVYTLAADASDPLAERLALAQNRSGERGVATAGMTPAEARALIARVRRETTNRSTRMARHAVRALAQTTTMLPRPHREAGFAVLKAPDVPSVLIELGMMSNAEDEALLRRREHRLRLARAIAAAVDRHFAETAPIQIAG